MSGGHTHASDQDLATQRLRSVLMSNSTNDQSVLDEIKFLIEERGANPNIQDDMRTTPLKYVLMLARKEISGPYHKKSLEVFIFLLSRPNIDLSSKDILGDMLITTAVRMRDPKFLRILLSNPYIRQNIDIMSRGESPIHTACSYPEVSIESIKNLLQAGADPNIRCTKFGRTPLQWFFVSCRGNALDVDRAAQILQVFFQCPATNIGDPYLRDRRGRTLLHYTVEYMPSRHIIDMLLERGENRSLEIRDKDGLTPMEYVQSFENAEADSAFQNYFRGRFGRGRLRLA